VRCIVYSRFSTDKQSESSIEDQQRVCRDFAAARGWSVAAEYSDRGISGAALGNRPGVRAALESLNSGDVLLVNDLSRLSRSQDLSPLLARLRHRGVRILGAQDAYDSDNETAGMQAGLSGIMSEEFRRNISRRTHSALALRAQQGLKVTRPPFDNPDLVREMFERFAGGESLRAIAGDLNARGIRARPRGKWLQSAVRAILTNEVYIGRVIWNRSRWVKDPDTGTRHRRERPRSEWIVKECEPVVSQDVWDRAQARFRSSPGRGGVPSYLLSGLLVCGVCGGKLIVSGGSSRRYVCGTRHQGGDAACSNRLGVARRIAEAYILDGVEAALRSPTAQYEALKEMRRVRAEGQRTDTSEPDAELATLERLVATGVLSVEVAAPALDAARRKAAQRAAPPTEPMPWPTAARWNEAVNAFCDVLRGSEVTAAREALREEIGEVRCIPEGDVLVAELGAERVLLATGSGISIGSGGPLRIHIPTRIAGTPLSRRGKRPSSPQK
jgi:site-specific DNA recombinase